RQQGSDRVLEAHFGVRPDEYLLLVDHHGQSAEIEKLTPAGAEIAADVPIGADWRYVGGLAVPADASDYTLFVQVGNSNFGIVTVPLDGASPTVHEGGLAGFVDASVLDPSAAGAGSYVAAGEPIVPGPAYAMPPLDQLIAEHLGGNQTYPVLLKG